MYDILEEGLCLIDNIEADDKDRSQLPQLGALYLYDLFSFPIVKYY